ncbi:unnamed protein product [Sphagnum balticum]
MNSEIWMVSTLEKFRITMEMPLRANLEDMMKMNKTDSLITGYEENEKKNGKEGGDDEEQLSDYGEEEDDDEVSQYRQSLFGDQDRMTSRDDARSIRSVEGPNSFKMNSSYNVDGMSDDVKQSERTVDMYRAGEKR